MLCTVHERMVSPILRRVLQLILGAFGETHDPFKNIILEIKVLVRRGTKDEYRVKGTCFQRGVRGCVHTLAYDPLDNKVKETCCNWRTRGERLAESKGIDDFKHSIPLGHGLH